MEKKPLWRLDDRGVIQSALDDKALQSRVNNRAIEMQSFDERPEQQWRFQGRKILNECGDCLDISNASNKDGAEVIAYPYFGGDSQHWRSTNAQRYEFFIVSELNSKVLDIDVATPHASGASVFVYKKKNPHAKSQLWYLDEQNIIRSALNDLALHCDFGDHNLKMQMLSDEPEQQWHFEGMKVVNGYGRKCLDIKNALRRDGAEEVVAYPYSGGDQQHWRAVYTQRRDFFIVSDLNDKVLDVAEANPHPGAKVVINTKKDLSAKSQLWYLDGESVIRSALNDFALHSNVNYYTIRMQSFTGAPEQRWRFQERKVVNGCGDCLDIKASNGDEAELIAYPYFGCAHQHWRAEDAQRHDFVIVSNLNDKVLGIEEANQNPGAKVIMYKRKNPPAKSQLWYLDGQGIIRSALNDFVFHSSVKHQSLEMQPFTGEPEQQWSLTTTKVVNRCGDCLDIKNASTGDGAEVIANRYIGGKHQRWRAEYPRRRDFCLVSNLNGKVLGIEEANQNPGAKVIMYTKKDPPAKSQLWYQDGEGIIRSALNNFVLHSSGTSSKGKRCRDKFLEKVQQEVGDGTAYKCDSSPRGRAVIINNQYFTKEYLSYREGADKDRDNLNSLFSFLDFETVIHSNKTAEEITNILTEESSQECHIKYDMFVLFLLSHGIQGKIYGIDGEAVEIEKLISLFDGNSCQNLLGKPKLIFIQACQGDLKSVGVRVDSSDMKADASDMRADTKAMMHDASSGENQDDTSNRTVSNEPASWNIKDTKAVFEKLKEKENLDLCFPHESLPIQSNAVNTENFVETDGTATTENSNATGVTTVVLDQEATDNTYESCKIMRADRVQIEVSSPFEPKSTIQTHSKTKEERIMEKADMAIFYATVPGYLAWRRIDRGSFFVQCLIDVLGKHAHCNDFMSISAKVLYALQNYEPIPGEKHTYIQMGQARHTLTKTVYLLPNNKLYNI